MDTMAAVTRGAEGLTVELLVWVGVLIGVVLVGGWLILVLRRRLYEQGGRGGQVPFHLHELRRMHARGQLDDRQYERAKAQVIAMTRQSGSGGKGEDVARDRKGRSEASWGKGVDGGQAGGGPGRPEGGTEEGAKG